MSRHHHKKRFNLRSFYLWHRYMGISAAAFVLLIAATGMLLNHTDDFAFGKQHVRSGWILDWYGIKAPETLHSFPAGGHYITLMGEDLYLDQYEIRENSRQLAGVVFADDMFVIAVNNSILLLTLQGEQIDYLRGKDGVPSGIQQIGIDAAGSIVVRTDYERYQPDANFLHWQRRDNDVSSIRWTSPSVISVEFKAALQQHFRGEVLPVERVLLDMHSGRFFGRFGTLIFDIAALLLIFLALSGSWIWLKRKR
ncbi:MAG: PepSY domain-containing protein [Mariprofundaceae bacterium]|nr:PepSY domain-containing protein [Mariprofundaceae bacterium]